MCRGDWLFTKTAVFVCSYFHMWLSKGKRIMNLVYLSLPRVELRRRPRCTRPGLAAGARALRALHWQYHWPIFAHRTVVTATQPQQLEHGVVFGLLYTRCHFRGHVHPNCWRCTTFRYGVLVCSVSNFALWFPSTQSVVVGSGQGKPQPLGPL